MQTLDATTAKSLELLQNLKDPKSGHSLYGVLNYTKTVGGARLLRSNILQPPSSKYRIPLVIAVEICMGLLHSLKVFK